MSISRLVGGFRDKFFVMLRKSSLSPFPPSFNLRGALAKELGAGAFSWQIRVSVLSGELQACCDAV